MLIYWGADPQERSSVFLLSSNVSSTNHSLLSRLQCTTPNIIEELSLVSLYDAKSTTVTIQYSGSVAPHKSDKEFLFTVTEPHSCVQLMSLINENKTMNVLLINTYCKSWTIKLIIPCSHDHSYSRWISQTWSQAKAQSQEELGSQLTALGFVFQITLLWPSGTATTARVWGM